MKAKTALGVTAMVLSIAVSAGAELITDHGAPFYNSVTEAAAAGQKAGVPTVVKFYTDW